MTISPHKIKYEDDGSIELTLVDEKYEEPHVLRLLPTMVQSITLHGLRTRGPRLLPDTEINCLVVHPIETSEGGFEKIAIRVNPNMTVGELLSDELQHRAGGYRKTSHVELRLAEGIV